MADKLKYPIGTRIKYLGPCKKCKGKVGEIVGVGDAGYMITLPQSTCGAFKGRAKTICGLNDIKPLAKMNEQLEFEFMSEST